MLIRHVMLATDFSPAAEAAAEVARGLATELKARLHIVHVVPPLTDPAYEAERLEAEVTRLGVPAEAGLRRGPAAAELIAYAREKGIDLIVVGSHGRTGFTRALLGSVAEQVVRLAPCLVLSVPATFALAPGEHAALPQATPLSRACLVCAKETDGLICSACRERIRGEALVHKMDVERAGRRGA